VTDISTLPAGVKPEQHIALVQQAFADIATAVTVNAVKYVLDRWDAIATYARKVKDKQIAADAAEIKKRGERRIGEMMKAQKETIGFNKGGGDHRVKEKPGALSTLAEAGIDKNLANAARKQAAKSEEQFEADVAENRANIINGKRKPKKPAKAKGVNAKLPPVIIDADTADAPKPLCLRCAVFMLLDELNEGRIGPDDFIQRIKDVAAKLLAAEAATKAHGEDDAEASAAKRKADYAAVEVR
jgi:hypothetical protein